MIPASRTELPEIFADKKEPLARFIAANQLKMQHPEDFVAVVKKHNELVGCTMKGILRFSTKCTDVNSATWLSPGYWHLRWFATNRY